MSDRRPGDLPGSKASPIHLKATRADIREVLERWLAGTCGDCGVGEREHGAQGHVARMRPVSLDAVRVTLKNYPNA